MRIAVITISLLAAGAAPAASEEKMKASDIQRDIIGSRIYLSAPLGGELPLHYQRNGKVDGSGEAVGLGKFLKPNDSGRWWIAGDKLCQQFTTWYDGKQMCFDLTRKSGTSVAWRRDNGETGLARIGQ